MTPFRLTPAAAVLGLCIALGPALAGFFIYKGIKEAKLGDRYVTVKGLVERIEYSDRGTWEISFKASGNELNSLYEKLASDAGVVKNFVVKQGLAENELSLSSPRVTDLHSREYGSGTLSPERYLVEYTLSVNSSKVDILDSLSGKAGELLKQGITISITNVRFYLDKFNDLRPALVEAATKNALEVAKSFAKTTESQIGGIRIANQGVIQISSPDASPTDTYDNGLTSLKKKIRVVSTLDFYLN